jgi:hypothetical protein
MTEDGERRDAILRWQRRSRMQIARSTYNDDDDAAADMQTHPRGHRNDRPTGDTQATDNGTRPREVSVAFLGRVDQEGRKGRLKGRGRGR